MSVEVRTCADLDEYERAFMAIGQYFGSDGGSEAAERFSRLLPLERMHAAWDGDEIVGGTGAYPIQLAVPGGAVVPCTGTTVVGVMPTHRRRGVLRAMMRAHLDDAHERGDPLAALWASEETIYGRFGFGRASFAGEVTVPSTHAGFAVAHEPRGRMRLIGRDEALDAFPPLWDALARVRPGFIARSREWWELRILDDPPDRRDGAGPKRFALLEIDGEPAGYAIYRHRMSWEAGASSGTLAVVEAIAPEAAALAEVWRFLLDVDWIAGIRASLLPPDHPLMFVLAEPRRAKYRLGDGLWVRLVDVGAALAARTYLDDRELVVELRDEFCPWNEGRWRLAGGSAERTSAAADLALDAATLGAAYLGGIGVTQLAQGGQVEELTAGALERADAIFRHSLHPWCPELF